MLSCLLYLWDLLLSNKQDLFFRRCQTSKNCASNTGVGSIGIILSTVFTVKFASDNSSVCCTASMHHEDT
jgi:hypothetical protein